MHHLVDTIATPELGAATQALGRLPKDALAEVRLDAFWSDVPQDGPAATQLEAVLEASAAPLIATLRPQRQGGAWHGDETIRVGLLEAAARSGFAWLDVENDLQAMAPLLHHLSKACRKIVLSNHLETMPDRDLGLRHLTAMQDLGGALHKLAFPAPSLPGHLRALELVWQHAQRHGHPAIQPITSPEDAPRIRALLALVGNQATYGHPDGMEPGTAGQPATSAIQAVWDHWGLRPEELGQEGGRPWYGVVGDPIDASLSPRIHNAALRHARKQARYGALGVPAAPGMLRLLLSVSPRIGLQGLSVTAPLKIEAAELVQCDDVATEVGAVNCIRVEQDGLVGTNTDTTALQRLLEPHAPGQTALVLGTGGAARAALHALQALGAKASVTGRDAASAQALANAFDAIPVAWDKRHDTDAQVLVQATPVDAWEGPVEGKTIVEMRYGAAPTALESAGAERITGRQVLLEQAIDAYRYWHQDAPDRDSMEAAL